MSRETPDVETFIFVKENISKYQLKIDITSKAIKNKLMEVNTTLKFEDKEENKLKSFFELTHATIIQVDESVQDKKELEKQKILRAEQDKMKQKEQRKIERKSSKKNQ